MTDADVVRVLRAWAPGASPGLGAMARRLALRIAAASAPVRIEPLGALARWRREVRDGVRMFGHTDELTRAAQWETVALERDRGGDARGAAEAMERAALHLMAHLQTVAPDVCPPLAVVA